MFEPKTVVAGSTGLSVLLLQEILVARKFKGKDGKELELDRSAGTNTIYALIPPCMNERAVCSRWELLAAARVDSQKKSWA